MIQITANTRVASVENKEKLTSGSVGIPVHYTFSDDWNDLTRVAVFRNDDDSDSQIDIILTSSNECTIPWENLKHPDTIDTVVFAGVYGSDGNGDIVIPTIWVSLGAVVEGAVRGNASGAEPTPDMLAQLETRIDALEVAITDAQIDALFT